MGERDQAGISETEDFEYRLQASEFGERRVDG